MIKMNEQLVFIGVRRFTADLGKPQVSLFLQELSFYTKI